MLNYVKDLYMDTILVTLILMFNKIFKMGGCEWRVGRARTRLM